MPEITLEVLTEIKSLHRNTFVLYVELYSYVDNEWGYFSVEGSKKTIIEAIKFLDTVHACKYTHYGDIPEFNEFSKRDDWPVDHREEYSFRLMSCYVRYYGNTGNAFKVKINKYNTKWFH